MRNRKTVCELHGVASYVERQQTEKQARNERILEMLKEKDSITNDDVEGPLGISHATIKGGCQVPFLDQEERSLSLIKGF